MNSLLNKLPYTEYCERQGSSAWTAEPINAITNLALFISAYFIWKLLKKHQITDWKFRLLPAIVFFIGIGSSAYHTFRNPYTHFMDAAPIYLFFLIFFYLFLRRFIRKASLSLLTTLFFAAILLMITFKTPRELHNASVINLFNAVMLMCMFLLAYKKFGKKAKMLFFTLITYSLAIFFRIIDAPFCSNFTIGTHFAWHIFTAITAYLAVKSLIIIYGSK